jgi:predicted phosphohydrolase
VRKALPEGCEALQNDAADLGEVVVAGSRCWAAPGALDYTPKDQKIYEREVHRLGLSLNAASQMADGRPIIAAIHYPPFTADGKKTQFVDLLQEHGVKTCVYGHLHGRRAHQTAIRGEVEGITYRLIACDFLDFSPTQVWP